MSWLWVILMFGFGPILIGAVVVLGLMMFLTGSIGVDGLFAASEAQETLTCWHCGQKTTAGRRHCQHCQRELQ